MHCRSVTTYRLGRGWNFSSRTSRVIIIVMFFGGLSACLALGSRYWQHVTNDFGTAHSGLWVVCILNRCHQFIHQSLYEWFHIVQSSMLIGFFVQTAGTTIFFVQMFIKHQSEMPWKMFKFIALFCFIVSGTLSFAAVLLYGIYQGIYHDPSSLSWGYGLAVFTCVLQLISGLLIVFELINTGVSNKLNSTITTGSQEMVLLQYPRPLDYEYVLFSKQMASTQVDETCEEENITELDSSGSGMFTPKVESTKKQSSKGRKISISNNNVRERSSTLDSSYNSLNFPR